MEGSALPTEIFDHNILTLVFKCISSREWETSSLRLVCRVWNETILMNLRTDQIYNLIFDGHYLSAIKLMEMPKINRPRNRIRPKKILNMVCGRDRGTRYHKIHCGLIKYFFYKFYNNVI